MTNARFLIVFDDDNEVTYEKDNASDHLESTEILEEINAHLSNIDENIVLLRNEQETEQEIEQETEQEIEQETEQEIEQETEQAVFDEHLYLSGTVENKDINDVYSMLLSTRNIVLLFFLLFLGFKIFGALKNVIYRIMDK